MDTKLTAQMFRRAKLPELRQLFDELGESPSGRWLLGKMGEAIYDAMGMKVSSLPRIPNWAETLVAYPRAEQPQRPEVGPLMAGKSGEDGSVYLGYGTLEGKLLLVLPDFRALQPKGQIKSSSVASISLALRGIGANVYGGRVVDHRPVRWRVTNLATGMQQTYMREADALSEKARIINMLQGELPVHLQGFVKVDPDTVKVDEVRE